MKPYEEYVQEFDEVYLTKLLAIASTVEMVDELIDEEEKLAFVQAFRALMRLRNILVGFSDFDFADLQMGEQEFEDYKSKYLDIYESIKSTTEREKVSILEDVDFELELIHKDEINVNYILMLLGKLKDAKEEDKEAQREHIDNIIKGDASLRSKRELIEKFINENLMQIEESEMVMEEFEKFWEVERAKGFAVLCAEENLKEDEVERVIGNYMYDERQPLKEDIAKTLNVKPKLLERRKVIPRVTSKILGYVEKFMDVGVVNNIDDEVLMVAEPKEGYGE
jgi:type I restriction enzyme R subunit